MVGAGSIKDLVGSNLGHVGSGELAGLINIDTRFLANVSTDLRFRTKTCDFQQLINASNGDPKMLSLIF